jgi:hypothetical protein
LKTGKWWKISIAVILVLSVVGSFNDDPKSSSNLYETSLEPIELAKAIIFNLLTHNRSTGYVLTFANGVKNLFLA